MSVTVQYSTRSDVRNAGQPSRTYPKSFGSLEAALNAPFPDECESALFDWDDGFYTRTAASNWEFHKKP